MYVLPTTIRKNNWITLLISITALPIICTVLKSRPLICSRNLRVLYFSNAFEPIEIRIPYFGKSSNTKELCNDVRVICI